MNDNLVILGTKNFNNSLDEIKEDLGFSLNFIEPNKSFDPAKLSCSAVIIDSDVCENSTYLTFINKILNKPILLLKKKNFESRFKYDDKNLMPISFADLKSKIKNLIMVNRFNKNSSIKIKDFILDKNEKKLKKNNLSIIITEREVQLIELLFNEKKPLSKNIILKNIWKYSDDADTHTVETHIYRLRKKVLNKFKEEKFIINSKLGYFI